MNKIYGLRFAGNEHANWVVAAPSTNAARKFITELSGVDAWMDINETYAQIIGTASGTYANTVDPVLIARG